MLRAITASLRLFVQFLKGFIALRTPKWVNLIKKREELLAPPISYVAHLGAQVASQQSPILRMGNTILAEETIRANRDADKAGRKCYDNFIE